MTSLKSTLAGISLLAISSLPSFGQAKDTAKIVTAPSNQEVSFDASLSVRNGYYFTIGPLAGCNERAASKFVNQANLATTIGKFTLGTWIDYVPLRGQFDEIDATLKYAAGSAEFPLGKKSLALAVDAGIMAFMYPGGSLAGGASDILPNVNVNISYPLIDHKKTSLNVFYMHNIVKDEFRRGGALMVTLGQELGQIGPVSLSANAYGAYGADLYEFNGYLLSRLGTKASVKLSEHLTLSADYSYQITGKNQDRKVIPQESIFGATLSTNF